MKCKRDQIIEQNILIKPTKLNKHSRFHQAKSRETKFRENKSGVQFQLEHGPEQPKVVFNHYIT